MLEKLEGLADRYDELENQLASPNLYDDPERAAALTKEHRNLQPILKTYRAYQTACQDEQDAKELLEEAGFVNVQIFGDQSFDKPKPQEMRVHICATRE